MQSTNDVRFGILGTGKIAHKFAASLQYARGARLAAVGSRQAGTAVQFADSFGSVRAHGSYEALMDDPEVDVVYVATPHNGHHRLSIDALTAGKHVLVEKPFALNAQQAAEMIAEARKRDLFLMEAMWMRFFPLIRMLMDLISDGEIGEVRMVNADFGFRADFGPEHRLFNPDLGGGALLDVGIYPVNLACMILGLPDRMVSIGHTGNTGVDEQAGILFGYNDGRIATLYTSSRVDTPVEAHVMGTRGRITLHRRMHQPTVMTVVRDGREPERIEHPHEGNGMNYEADEVVRCIRAGERESSRMPLDETLALMKLMDTLRASWGVKYPGE